MIVGRFCSHYCAILTTGKLFFMLTFGASNFEAAGAQMQQTAAKRHNMTPACVYTTITYLHLTTTI
jgi:hypothetical protein